MSPSLTIKEGAIFIADAHDTQEQAFFFEFLLHVKELKPTQLFLMGDMFDLLVGDVEYGVQKYAHYIKLINDLAQNIEVVYFEGNHDFCLQSLFKNVRVVPLLEQPLLCTLPDGKSCLLSHGDKFGNFSHRFFTKIIRNKKVLFLLNLLDKNFHFFISKKIQSNQRKKNLCRKIGHFKALVEAKIGQYKPSNIDVIAEGHYHQDCSFKVNQTQYVNFSSFACNRSYFIVQSFTETEFAQKQLRGFNG